MSRSKLDRGAVNKSDRRPPADAEIAELKQLVCALRSAAARQTQTIHELESTVDQLGTKVKQLGAKIEELERQAKRRRREPPPSREVLIYLLTALTALLTALAVIKSG